ncbi:alpha/beta fold hydrolase [Flavobacterium sedimenticola]|uniref:Alpha/beta fold hydrolase n=1 Tax=Flavobacterium sedimenticola TaxID=3043286 RepID=A0ABT6XSS6_9FLAO|nr:alpha/beta fold hydrolase [Flavobacterium sedimenticola]MDI9258160.1 alpha/beta fold hydrolase [Flavobacterium sedimenticola]
MKISYWMTQALVYLVLLMSQHLTAHSKGAYFWVGKLVLSEAVQLDVALEYTASGTPVTAKFHSVTQSSFDIKVSQVSIINQEIRFTIPSLMAAYHGVFVKDTLIKGELKQGSNTPWTLNFNKVNRFPFAKPYRPQEPTGIPAYFEKEVRFENAKAGITLAGTLTLPKGKNDFPTVVLLTGSGPNDRDHSIFGHKNFLVLADFLTKAGIGVLRVDDRGVGASGGSFASASVLDLADDASAAVDFLSAYPGINAQKIGLIGHSLGAELAAVVAAKNRKVHFIVMMAGGAQPLSEVILEQTKLIYKNKVSTAALDLNTALLELLFQSLQNNDDLVSAKLQFTEGLEKLNPKAALLTKEELQILELESPLTTKGFNHFFTPNWKIDLFYDCTVDLAKTTIPVLALNGNLDTQVVPDNLKIIEKVLSARSNSKHKTILYDGLNHLFQPADTGLPEEYKDIEITIDEAVVSDMITWIRNIN